MSVAGDDVGVSSNGMAIQVFRPTWEEFKDFNKYIQYMESKGAHKAGLAKVIPPPEWVPRKSGYDLEQLNVTIPSPICQACLNVLTKQEASPCVEKEEVKVEVERFIDLARQMEAFFLQKRFLLSAMRPELLVKEDNNELKCELQRKEELLRRHYDKISQWQNLLADLQGHTVYNKCQQQTAQAPPAVQQAPAPQHVVQQSVQAQQMAAAAAQQAVLQQQAALQQQQVPRPPHPPAYPANVQRR